MSQQQKTENIQCTDWCKHMVGQVDVAFMPKNERAPDVFALFHKTYTKQKEELAALGQEIDVVRDSRTLMQSVACWALARLRMTTDMHALRYGSLFINKLEESLHFLEQALILDAKASRRAAVQEEEHKVEEPPPEAIVDEEVKQKEEDRQTP